MAFFLVDMEFRAKAKQLLTAREVWFCVVIAFLALLPWSEVAHTVLSLWEAVVSRPAHLYVLHSPPVAAGPFDHDAIHCNPKFAQSCADT